MGTHIHASPLSFWSPFVGRWLPFLSLLLLLLQLLLLFLLGVTKSTHFLPLSLSFAFSIRSWSGIFLSITLMVKFYYSSFFCFSLSLHESSFLSLAVLSLFLFDDLPVCACVKQLASECRPGVEKWIKRMATSQPSLSSLPPFLPFPSLPLPFPPLPLPFSLLLVSK